MKKNNFKKEAIFVTFLMISMSVILPSTQAIYLFKNNSENNKNIIIQPKACIQGGDFSIEIHWIEQEDEIDPGTGANWKIRMYINGQEQSYKVDGDSKKIYKTFTWKDIIQNGQSTVEVKLLLQEEDWGWWSNDDIADISAHEGGGADDTDDFDDYRGAIFRNNFSLEENNFFPKDKNNDEVSIDDTSNIRRYITSGNFDGSNNRDENDATICFSVSVSSGNNPPYVPEKPSGPEAGKINIIYTYETSSSDPDGDRVKFGWDWDGDSEVEEITDFYDSWQTCTIRHTWLEPGIFAVKVMAIDDKGTTSELSEPLFVKIESPGGGVDGATRKEEWYGLNYTIYLDHKHTQELYTTIQQGTRVIAAVAALIAAICTAAGVPINTAIATAIAIAIVKLTAESIKMMDTGSGVYFRVIVLMIAGFPVGGYAYIWSQ